MNCRPLEKYDPKAFEDEIYTKWLKNNVFCQIILYLKI